MFPSVAKAKCGFPGCNRLANIVDGENVIRNCSRHGGGCALLLQEQPRKWTPRRLQVRRPADGGRAPRRSPLTPCVCSCSGP